MKALIVAMMVFASSPAWAAPIACSTIPLEAASNKPEPQGDPRWPDRFREAQAAAAASDADLLLLGDSIIGRWRPTLRETQLRGISNIDLGIDGDRVAQVRWRLQNGVAMREPKYIALSVGTNDISHEPSVEIASGIFATVSEVRVRYPNAKIILLSVMPRYGKSPDDAQIVEVNDLLARCNAGRYYFLDQWAAFSDGEGNLSHDLSDDGLHPNDRGYRLMGKNILTAIAALGAQQ
jgi:lysophospholipase L1-like esterase